MLSLVNGLLGQYGRASAQHVYGTKQNVAGFESRLPLQLVGRGQGRSVPAKTCQAKRVLAKRLKNMYVFSPVR